MISRYDPVISEDPYLVSQYAEMEEEKNGEWVKHEDYQVLEERIAELESHNKALIAEGDELDKRWISRDKRIAELKKENVELLEYLKEQGCA